MKCSVKRLEALLTLNFTASARLVTLTYGTACHPRSRELAICFWRDWTNAVRRMHRAQGASVRYVGALSWSAEQGETKHLAVLEGPNGVTLPPTLWPYGDTEEAPVDLTHGWAVVAALMMRDAIAVGQTPVPCARSWTASLGLLRPEQQIRQEEIPNGALFEP